MRMTTRHYTRLIESSTTEMAFYLQQFCLEKCLRLPSRQINTTFVLPSFLHKRSIYRETTLPVLWSWHTSRRPPSCSTIWICSYGWGKNRNESYRYLSYEYTPLRILGTPISKVIERIQSISYDGNRQYYASTSRYDKEYYHEPAKYIAALSEKLEKAKRRVSLCLDCVQGSDETESPKFEHKDNYYWFN